MNYKPIIQNLPNNFNYQFDVLRLDLLNPEISGNKWFKLKKNIEKAIQQNKKTVITFGGAFSNHIAATAAYCKQQVLNTIGIIRGEETEQVNSTLLKAQENGMQLHFVPREFYSQKNTEQMVAYLQEKFGDHYLIPEGGNNEEGVLGCMEIIDPSWNYDYIFCACGTGTTYAGILLSAKPQAAVIGINVLKGENKLASETESFINALFPEKKQNISSNHALDEDSLMQNCITNKYCFSGYAKFDKQLVDFKKDFESDSKIPLDYVYTNKLFYAVFDLAAKNKLKPNSKSLIIHSGGLQGNAGFEKRFGLL